MSLLIAALGLASTRAVSHEETYHNPVDKKDYLASGGWQNHTPDGGVTPSAEKVYLDGVRTWGRAARLSIKLRNIWITPPTGRSVIHESSPISRSDLSELDAGANTVEILSRAPAHGRRVRRRTDAARLPDPGRVDQIGPALSRYQSTARSIAPDWSGAGAGSATL